MRIVLSTLIALGLFAGVANAADLAPIVTDTSIVEWCGYTYYGH